MLNPTVIIGIIGATAIVGYIANLIFSKTRIPDVIWLLVFGVAISWAGFATGESFLPIVPIVASIAIVMLSLDSGMRTKVAEFKKHIPRTFLLAFLCVIFSTIGIAAVGIFVVGLDPIIAFIFGAALSAVSSATTVRSFVDNIRGKSETKMYMEYESILSDLIAIILVTFFVGLYITHAAGLQILGVVLSVGVGAVLGFGIGLLWLVLLNKIRGRPFDYVATLGLAFILYFIAESVSPGAGIIMAIFFGLVLGQGKVFSRFLRVAKIDDEFTISNSMKKFQSEISFFIRAFFFVMLGILAFGMISQQYMVFGLIISAVIILIRIPAVKIALTKKDLPRRDMCNLFTNVPRDLSAIVLIQIAVIAGVSMMTSLYGIVFVVIFSTVVFSTIAMAFLNRCPGQKEDEKEVPGYRYVAD
ncbi:MAG: cation:proton antiporter [Candidatus Aenigmatarchaeota archaeon]